MYKVNGNLAINNMDSSVKTVVRPRRKVNKRSSSYRMKIAIRKIIYNSLLILKYLLDSELFRAITKILTFSIVGIMSFVFCFNVGYNEHPNTTFYVRCATALMQSFMFLAVFYLIKQFIGEFIDEVNNTFFNDDEEDDDDIF